MSALDSVRADLASKRLQLPDYDLIHVFHRAEFLSAKYAATIGMRSLDILRVAAALGAGCREFVSFDERQRKVAAKARLAVFHASSHLFWGNSVQIERLGPFGQRRLEAQSQGAASEEEDSSQ